MDDAFIRAVRESPDNETARLVYADWLDEQGDARGEYLRTEATWAQLPPADRESRPLLRRLSELAAGFDPAWLTAASRMSGMVRRAWEPISSGFAPIAATDLPETWADAVGRMRASLSETFGADEVTRRFCMPADYATFQSTVGGHRLDDRWLWLLSPEEMVEANLTYLRMYEPGRPRRPDEADDQFSDRWERPEIWLKVGLRGDMDLYFLCCDLDSPCLGVVAEGEDYHPWMGGVEPMDFRGRNFLHFLTGYLPTFLNRDWDSWPRVPHCEWATW